MQEYCDNNETSSKKYQKMKIKQHILRFVIIILIILVIIAVVVFCFLGIKTTVKDEVQPISGWTDKLSNMQKIWFDNEYEELKNALSITTNTNRAKYVILFVGDGMGPATLTGSRIYRYGESGKLSWESFPNMGLLKTYCANKQVPDSTATATALFCGIKSNYETGGVDASVNLSDCASSLKSQSHAASIVTWAQDRGMSTGFVTTTRVVHATPSVLYSHIADRRWECESKMKKEDLDLGCRDIARQLVEFLPGKNINVIMGGGKQCLVSNVTGTDDDPIDTYSCYSQDGRDLIKEWANDKTKRNLKHAVVQNTDELNKLNVKNTDYLLGIFANGHMSYEDLRNKNLHGRPSLKQMTSSAIKILSKNEENGFLLVVESGLIDQAHHRGWAKRAFSEVLALDDAVIETINLMNSKKDETLIIVTSDHSHTLTINGYPAKGNSIFGIAGKSKFDGVPYTTLTYGTGHFGYQIEGISREKFQRSNPLQLDTEAFDYVQQVAVKTDENTHGGLDVPVFAIGPMAHLFNRVHEQTYVAHVISYAARIGRFNDQVKV